MTCKPITYGAPGDPCDGTNAFCGAGFCNFTASPAGGLPTGTCPTIVADGQPCTPAQAAVCDTYATCAAPEGDAGCCLAGGGGPGGPASSATANPPPPPSPTCVLLDPSSCN
jgi:hypothetical protein